MALRRWRNGRVDNFPRSDDNRTMSWIQTFTGRQFYPLTPRPADVDIRDIAHALAFKCRFCGHARVFYSIAEHSVRVSHVVPETLALAGLLHDAAEAYLADVSRPVKHALWVRTGSGSDESFDALEARVLVAICAGLGVPPVDYVLVAPADNILLATELRDLMAPPPEPWNLGAAALADRIVPLTAAAAEAAFLQRYTELRACLRRGPKSEPRP